MIYKYTAENIDRPTAVKLVRELEAKSIEVEHADVGKMFTNEMLLIVTCGEATAKIIRDRIWELNAGLCCDMHTITPEQLATYIGE